MRANSTTTANTKQKFTKIVHMKKNSTIAITTKWISATERSDRMGSRAPRRGRARVSVEQAVRFLPTENQDYAVTGTEEATNTVSSTTDPNTNRGARTYTVSGLAAGNYDIALFDPARITTDENGVVTFRDTEGTTATTDDNNQADNIGESKNYSTVNGDPDGALIETVNGADVTDAKYINNVTPSNGTITFVVDSEDTDSAQPVVFQDADNDNQLDLDANNQPTENFGVGGVKNWVPTEAAFGAFGVNVEQVNKSADFFVGSDLPTSGSSDTETNAGTFYYDANDVFRVGGNLVTLAEFESVLSEGDDVRGTYRTEASGVSEFNLTDTGPAAPSNVTATAADYDNDGARDDVRVSWTASTTSGVQYDVKRVNTAAPGANNCTEAGVLVADNTSATTVTENNVPDGTYIYCVQAVQGSGDVQSSSAFVASNSVTVPGAADAGQPISQDAVVTTNGPGLTNTFDTGDVFKVVFSEPMAAPNAGDTIRGRDADGTIADFINGTNATFTLNATAETVNGVSRPANTVLTVTLTSAPTAAAAGTTAGLQIPATVVDQSGNTDLAGNAWNITTGDVELDQDANDSVANSSDATAPTISSASRASASTVTVTMSEAVRGFNGDVAAGQFAYNDGDGPLVLATAASVSGDTITLTFPADTVGAADGDDFIVYNDDNDTAADAGDVVDFSNNPLADDPTTLVGGNDPA